jgi:hypothetical protein
MNDFGQPLSIGVIDFFKGKGKKKRGGGGRKESKT